MCAVSMVGDYYTQKYQSNYNNQGQPQGTGIGGLGGTFPVQVAWPMGPSTAEFEALKKEVLEMKELLKRAKLYDEQTNQPDCEQEEKIALLRKVAAAVGVDLDEVFGPKP